MNKHLSKILIALLAIFLSLIILELINLIIIHNPVVLRHLPYKINSHYRNLYLHTDMRIIQYNADCSQYDKELSYKLKPGECTFSGIEFTNTCTINSMGLRDDEKSLIAPTIIVLGDSYAMGWGVEDDEIFSSVIEEKTGLTVLNAAISSYGTVREMKTLGNLDTTNLEYLILQYCGNDFEENERFYKNNNRFYPKDATKYHTARNEHLNNIKYYFGKYIFFSIKLNISDLFHDNAKAPADLEVKKIFKRVGILSTKT